jgi:hypothetical protein
MCKPPDATREVLCPSARPDIDGSRVFGVVAGTTEKPHVRLLRQTLPVVRELLDVTGAADPAEVFRFAAPCAEAACRHFDGSRCRLGERVVQILPVASLTAPPCPLRPQCRWWQEQGKAACMRCPQVVSQVHEPSAEYRRAAIGDND